MENSRKRISFDNGCTWFYEASEIENLPYLWRLFMNFADQETVKEVERALLTDGDCTIEEFLDAYLDIAPSDLVIG